MRCSPLTSTLGVIAMVVRFNTDLLDNLIAPGISKFTTCDALDLTEDHPQAAHWLVNHFLNNLFGPKFKNTYRQYAINLLFRAEVAFHDYHEARVATFEYLEKGKPDSPAIRTYFRAISRWESCLLNIQVFIDLINKMHADLGDLPCFTENDGSKEQRAYSMANTVKHWGGDLAKNRHEEHHTIPLWLTNSGLTTRTHQITFGEISESVREISVIADELQSPKSFANSP